MRMVVDLVFWFPALLGDILCATIFGDILRATTFLGDILRAKLLEDALRRFLSHVLESIFLCRLSLTFSRSRNTFLRHSLSPKDIVDAGFRYFLFFSRRLKEMKDMQLSSLE
ncbi:hypothetical protein H0G86_012425 [Trichoderma simmonsii]|uniref:Uncharacterized protein n=1 Tax=Trichoderma simmonsii TaxID=1491479 RepID=A0A8G0LTI0_9HYPO|nr:hypothetical protein H0G86_012425 [Trichoderma simmonsii]